jgi:serine/threonine protein kinase
VTVLSAIQAIEAATSPVALFGAGHHDAHVYRRLAKLCHPDNLIGNPLQKRAESAFRKLTDFYTKASGTTPAFTPIPLGEWIVTAPFATGHVADLFYAEPAKPKDPQPPAVLKIARQQADNDLMEREYATLKRLHREKPETFHVYLPTVLSHFSADHRKTTVFTHEAEAHSLDFIVAQMGKLPFVHIVWMGNRLWSVLGFAHQHNVIHGAILPEHLLYRPADHGLKLVDWCYSVNAVDQHIPAIVPTRKAFYPKEVGRRTCALGTDIYMAAQCLRFAAAEIPKRFKALFDWMLAESPASRPQDAWGLADQWKSLAAAEYGKPRFVELKVPVQ